MGLPMIGTFVGRMSGFRRMASKYRENLGSTIRICILSINAKIRDK